MPDITHFLIPENTNLLAVCCTFRRPEMLKTMIESFEKTRSDSTQLIVYLHDDDPCLTEYKEIIKDKNYIIGKHRYLQEVINHIVFDVLPKIPYYQIICDDHLYHTPQWDKLLIESLEKTADGWGFACGRDGINGDDWNKCQHPSAEIWSWKFCSTIGYVYPRTFKHTGMDFFTKNLGLAINGLVFVPEVMIEHLWYGGCGKPMDDNLKEKYANNSFDEGVQIYEKWKKEEMQETIDKINNARQK